MLQLIKKLIKSEKPLNRKPSPSRRTSDWLDAASAEPGVKAGFSNFKNGKYELFKIEVEENLILTMGYEEYKNLKALEQPDGIARFVELANTMSLNPTVQERIVATMLEETPSALLNVNVATDDTNVTIGVYGSTLKIVTTHEIYHVAKFIIRR